MGVGSDTKKYGEKIELLLQNTYACPMKWQDVLLRIYIFIGFRIWGIGAVTLFTYFSLTSFFPFLSKSAVGFVVGLWGVYWIYRSLFKLFTSKDP